jgi:hypothetical protein
MIKSPYRAPGQIPLLPALCALNPFHYFVFNEGQPIFVDCPDRAEKNGAVDDGEPADPDDAVRFEARRFKIGIVLADKHIEIIQPLRQLRRNHAYKPIVKTAREFSNNKRGAEFAQGQVCLRKVEEDDLTFLYHLKLSLRSCDE